MKKNSAKYSIFFGLLGVAALAAVAALRGPGPNDGGDQASFAPLFTVLGKAPQNLSRTVTRVLPVNEMDEEEFGKALKQSRALYGMSDDEGSASLKSLKYLNALMKRLMELKKKKFDYEVRVAIDPVPNAFALPGGLIYVTSGLLDELKSESELVSVLGHEMGHIELSHCFDSVKYELLSKKLAFGELGKLADYTRHFFLAASFSKTQEDEADEYGFKVLENTMYDPAAMHKAFTRLRDHGGKRPASQPDPVRDYLLSHPPVEQRISKFSSKAKAWWSENQEARRYVGQANLTEKIDLMEKDYGESEWVNSYQE